MSGMDPEQTLVIETIGHVEDFASAVKKIEGMEWLGGIDIEDIAPDDDFYIENNRDRLMNGRLFMLMTNQRALEQLLSLWKQYGDQGDPKFKFDRGLNKFRDLFVHIKDIRRWDTQDRFDETGAIEAWEYDLEHGDGRHIRFEVELWFRNSDARRNQNAEHITNLVLELGGQVIGESVHEEIAYHGMIAELTPNAMQTIIRDMSVELFKTDAIMCFRPLGQIAATPDVSEADTEYPDTEGQPPLPDGPPVVAVVDGHPLTNHQLLDGRLTVDDPDNFGSSYQAGEQIHGTSMASLVALGDLNGNQAPLKHSVYIRPIMKPNPKDFRQPRSEHIPDDVLSVDLIHRAVKRMFEGDGPEDAVAESVRVINFSIGDPVRLFLSSMSPLARMLDWLSHKHGVLFVVSAGNHANTIQTDVSESKFQAMSADEREALVVESLFSDRRNRRLLSPAESINGLTVGAVQSDESQFTDIPGTFNPLKNELPSPISAFGGGYLRAIKPEVVYPGGRMLYREDLKKSTKTKYAMQPAGNAPRPSPPGNSSATPDVQPGGLQKTAYSSGTSNAAALVSREAGICYDSLMDILATGLEHEVDTRPYEVPLLKSMLVHGCTWGSHGTQIKQILKTSQSSRQINEIVSRWMGYGHPAIERILSCTEQRATLLGFGELSNDEAHVFDLPIPPSLGSVPEWRRLTVTLAWLSPIAAMSRKYRTAALWFDLDPEGAAIAKDRRGSSGGQSGWRAVRRGTIQHETFEGDRAVPLDGSDSVKIKVNCRNDAGKIESHVAYGLMVSLEVAEGVNIAVYDEIKTRLATAVQVI